MASRSELGCLLQSTIGIFYKICEAQKQLAKIKRRKNRHSNDNDLGAWGWQMARNDEAEEILALEMEASQIGYGVVEGLIRIGELELSNQFRWVAGHLMPKGTGVRSPAERKRLRQEISKRTKELSDVVKAKHIQHHLAFSCIDQHDECVRKRKRQKKSPYVCFLALFICLGSSMKGLLAAIAAAAAAGHHLPEIF